jgi:hypothetical protein
MPANSTHPEYNHARKRWDLVRSVVNNDAMHWIRTVDKNDPLRSDQYKKDAILTNFTSLTKVGLTGLVFRRKPKLTIPAQLNYILDDATGEALSLFQLSQKVIGEVLETGRLGLLVDYPQVEDRVSLLEDQQTGNVARIKPYAAEAIINWRTETFGSNVLLTLIVLLETVSDINDTDGFEWCQKKQYRVLRLTEDQVYTQSVYSEDLELLSVFIPTKADGSVWNEIPFLFVGSENNDANVDTIPLYDLAVLNIGHYRNSADYEESIFITGQPTLFLKGDGSLEEFKNVYPDGIRFGSRAGYYLGLNGGADLVQANPNQLAAVAMKDKLDQAALIGARLIAPAGGRETAEAARIRFSSQNSALYLITSNIGLALTKCLEWALDFMTSEDSVCSFILNDQFYDDAADPNLIAQQIMLMDRGVIAVDDIRDYARRTGVIDDARTNFELESEAEVLSPLPVDTGTSSVS